MGARMEITRTKPRLVTALRARPQKTAAGIAHETGRTVAVENPWHDDVSGSARVTERASRGGRSCRSEGRATSECLRTTR